MVKEMEKPESISGDIGRSEKELAGLKDSIELNKALFDYAKDELEANFEAMERDLAEILRWKGKQKRLWQEYEEWRRR